MSTNLTQLSSLDYGVDCNSAGVMLVVYVVVNLGFNWLSLRLTQVG